MVASGINTYRRADRAIILITHYQRLLELVQPDAVHVLVRGRIVKSGGPALATELEASGYDELLKAAQRRVRTGALASTVQAMRCGLVQNLVDKRGLAGAGDPGNTRKGSQWDRNVDVSEVVLGRAHDLQRATWLAPALGQRGGRRGVCRRR